MSLARSVRGLTLRLVDPEHSPEAEVQQAVTLVLPLLLEQVRGWRTTAYIRPCPHKFPAPSLAPTLSCHLTLQLQ